MHKTQPSCNDIFTNAMDVLPKYYRLQQFDSVSTAIAIWERGCGNIPQISITKLLLSIEQRTFEAAQPESTFISLLDEYAERYDIYSHSKNFYPPEQNKFYHFASSWAELLLENKSIDNNEQFICKVLAGKIVHPENEIRKNTETYPEYAWLLKKNDAATRNSPRINLTFTSGVWIPTGNLSLLGAKPSVGFQVGGRTSRHQIDFTTQVRFVNSQEFYTVERNHELIDRKNYFGWYIGLDYNYYMITMRNIDFGIVAGMGYDGFDITGSSYYYDYYYAYDYLSPHSIGSFNANAGLRFNYYLNPGFYIGLQGRYNWINYANPGGTNMNGDGYSIDLIIGFNHKDSYGHYY